MWAPFVFSFFTLLWFALLCFTLLCFAALGSVLYCANMIFRLLLWRACWMLNTFCNEKQIHLTINAIVRCIFGYRSFVLSSRLSFGWSVRPSVRSFVCLVLRYALTEFMHVHFTSFMSKNSHARVQTKCHTCRNERSHDKSLKLCSFFAKPLNTFEVFI